MKFMYFSIKYRYTEKSINLIKISLFCCKQTCYCVNMVSVTLAPRYIMSASHYRPRYQVYIVDPRCTSVV